MTRGGSVKAGGPLPLVAARHWLAAIVLLAAAAQAQDALHGTITDPSGAAIPGAVVQLRGPGGDRRARTNATGQFAFATLPPGRYRIRITARNFAPAEKNGFDLSKAAVMDVQLSIEPGREVITVDGAPGSVSADPQSNAGALTLGRREIAALSDDPDELALQLQALAGPAPGPDGGEIFVDGFSGANLPPKSAIREIRINANPYSPEYDRPGFAHVDVFTKPGSETFHGQTFYQFNDRLLDSRNPLLATSARPPFRTQLSGLSLAGPLIRKKAGFTLDIDHRRIDENALVLATTLDAHLNPVTMNQAVATPQSRTSITPRFDYSLNSRNTLTARYQDLRSGYDDQGVGDFSLPSRAYHEDQSSETAQVTETMVLGPHAMTETRFQFLRSVSQAIGLDHSPAIEVQGAFSAGGAPTGNSSTAANNWELSNLSTFTRRGHTIKWGGRVREARLTDLSYNNFAGTFTFFTLAQYQQVLALQPGAFPSQFTINYGTPAERVSQADAGLFVNDDWKLRSNLTLSGGMRLEAQSNRGDQADIAPRVAVAWGPGARGGRPAKTVLRAGVGTFYDRIPLAVTLNALRYNGIEQRSYFILNPAFFPSIPSLGALQASEQPQLLRPAFSGLRNPRLYQASTGIERQIGASSRLSFTWTHSRGVHLLNSRNVNTPISGAYPYGDPSIRLLTESAGLSRQDQLVANGSVNTHGVLLFGYYTLSYGRDNNEGQPADPYNLRAEWGPSSYGDIRHRLFLSANLALPAGFSLNPFLIANSGAPYNITTGLDPLDTGFPAARPALCQPASPGCFEVNPAIGMPVIEHNYGRGPADVSLALRFSRTWSFGPEGGRRVAETGPGNPQHEAMGMPQRAEASVRRYSLTLAATTMNVLNHPNYAPPDGDLSSPYFGQYRALGGLIVMNHGGGMSTYNRKIDLQLRLTF